MPRKGVPPLRALSLVFAALGDETRLGVLSALAKGEAQSISRLTTGTRLTRQAVTKHLRVLEKAGVVRSVRQGRENQFALRAESVDGTREFLETLSGQWGNALGRLQAYVEEGGVPGGGGTGARDPYAGTRRRPTSD